MIKFLSSMMLHLMLTVIDVYIIGFQIKQKRFNKSAYFVTIF